MSEKTIYQELLESAQAAGTDLAQICREEKINRTGIQHWKKSDPKSIRTYKILLEAIAKAKAKKEKEESKKK